MYRQKYGSLLVLGPGYAVEIVRQTKDEHCLVKEIDKEIRYQIEVCCIGQRQRETAKVSG